MVKHTQTIRRLLPTNRLSVFDHFVMLALKGLTKYPSPKAIPNYRVNQTYAILEIPVFQTFLLTRSAFPANNYLFKVNDRNARKRFEICSKLTIKTPEQRQ